MSETISGANTTDCERGKPSWRRRIACCANKLAEAQARIEELKRELFGPKSERLTEEQREQLEQVGRDLQDEAECPSAVSAEVLAPEPDEPQKDKEKRRRVPRHPLPAHLETETIVLEPEQTTCPYCGGEMACIGEEVSEEIELMT